MTPEDEAFALMCGREDRNTEYWHDWQDTHPSLHRCKPGRYYRFCEEGRRVTNQETPVEVVG